MDFGAFAKGYFNTASSMSEILLSKIHFSDYEAYPVIFLYRHSLELYLKNIIYKSSLIMTFQDINDLEHKLHNNHNLKNLSKIASKVLRKLFSHDTDVIKLSEEIVKISIEFSDIDPSSFSYRYPIDRKGQYSTKKHQVVNLQSVSETIDSLLGNLDILNFGLNIEMDTAQEFYELFADI